MNEIFYSKKRRFHYLPVVPHFYLLYMLLLVFTVFPLLRYISTSFLGLPFWFIEIFLMASILGSTINIPVFTMRRNTPIVRNRIVYFMGVPWVIPEITLGEEKTVIAINLGGCIIPTSFSLYIIYRIFLTYGLSLFILTVIGIIIDSLLIYTVARPVPGLGIATPAFLPPLFTALITLLLVPSWMPPQVYFAYAYSVGTLSALIGADLLNLNKIPDLGAPIASIGGAGTFDGIYLTGLLSIIFLM